MCDGSGSGGGSGGGGSGGGGSAGPGIVSKKIDHTNNENKGLLNTNYN